MTMNIVRKNKSFEERDFVMTKAFHGDYTALPKKTIINKTRKNVRFKENSMTTIESHRDYTSSERRSMWYTRAEYRYFASKIRIENSDAPLPERKKRYHQSMRIKNIRRCVLKAQSNRFLLKKQRYGIQNDNSQWLSDYYKHHSKPCITEARQRGIENDLELLSIKMKDMNKKQSIRSSCSKMYKTHYNKDTSNFRWSTRDTKVLKDVAPLSMARSSDLRRELCKDLFFRQESGREDVWHRRDETIIGKKPRTKQVKST